MSPVLRPLRTKGLGAVLHDIVRFSFVFTFFFLSNSSSWNFTNSLRCTMPEHSNHYSLLLCVTKFQTIRMGLTLLQQWPAWHQRVAAAPYAAGCSRPSSSDYCRHQVDASRGHHPGPGPTETSSVPDLYMLLSVVDENTRMLFHKHTHVHTHTHTHTHKHTYTHTHTHIHTHKHTHTHTHTHTHVCVLKATKLQFLLEKHNSSVYA